MTAERWSDDFEDDLVGLDIPKDRPLRLHLNASRTHSSLYSDAGDETSASGSALFSESDDNTDDAGSTREEAPSRLQSARARTNDINEDAEDEEEKSNTIKAGQLPAGFAEQLAASKAQAALAKAENLATTSGQAQATGESTGQIRHLGSVVQPPEQGFDWDEDIEGISTLKHGLRHKASFASHISMPDDPSTKVEKAASAKRPTRQRQISDRDIESDFELPEAVQNVSLASFLRKPPSESGRPSLKHSKSSTQLSDSVASKDSSTASKSKILPPPSAHIRSTSSLSTRTDGSEFTDKHDEDDLEGLVLPDDYFGAQAGSSSSSSLNTKTKVDLGALLRQKVRERQAKASGSTATHPRQSSSVSRVPYNKYKEKDDESFEEGLDVSVDLSIVASQGVRTMEKAKGKKSTGRSLSPVNVITRPPMHARQSLRSQRSAANLLTMASSVINPSSVTAASDQAGIRAPSLRSRPSYSNLGDHSRNAPSPQPSTSRTILRKKSSSLLANDNSSTSAGASRSIPTSSAHYSQPTRSSLARQQSVSDDGVSSAAYIPFRTGSIHQSSRSSTPVSPGSIPESSSWTTRSRFAQPTLSSQAKSRGAIRGSDPSGRSSASLGRPLSSATMSTFSLTARPMERRGAAKARGDGSELDTFDDLPVNKETEKKFMKIPRQRLLSEGAVRPNSPASSIVSGPLGKRVQRIRTESGSDYPSNISKRLSMHSERRTGSTSSSGGSDKAVQRPGSSRKAEKRPALKLIQNLSASKLTLVQGEMVFNPVSMTWEGNDSEVRMFDDIMASSSRPALISPVFGPMSPRVHAKSPLSTTSAIDSTTTKPETAGFPFGTKPSLGGVRIVGDMIFDPSKMCWFTTSQEGEEEIDFGDNEAEEVGGEGEKKSDPWKEGETMRLKTRRSFARNSSSASEHEEDEEAWDEEHFTRNMQAAEQAHKSEMKRFTMSKLKSQAELRNHLWDILDVVNI